MPSRSSAPARPQYVTLGDAAEYLSVTERTIRNYVSRGELSGYRLGGRSVRVLQHELDAMMTPIPTIGNIA